MKSDENVYIQAEQETKRLLANFANIRNLYEMIHHMRGKYMSDKSAADFYQLILDNTVGRDPYGCSKNSLIDKYAFEEIFNRCQGLFTYFEDDKEKQKILDELKRLQETNYV
jgi:hypothetical protein